MKNIPIKALSANGIELAYLEQGAGPLIICLHGFPDTPYSFVPFMGKLADAGFRVIAPFLRGYAPSTQPLDRDYSVMALAKDVLAFVEHFSQENEKVILIGHDWGGFACYAAANMKPEKIRCLIQMNVPHMAVTHLSLSQIKKSWYVWFFQLPFLPEKRLPQNNFAFIDKLYRLWSPHWQYTEANISPVKACLAQEGAVSVVLRYYRSMIRGISLRQIKLLRQVTQVPSLLIAGEADGSIGLDQFIGMDKAYSNVYRFISYSRVGHFPHCENLEQLTIDSVEFIQQCT